MGCLILDYSAMLMATVYLERNVVALGTKNYRCILFSWTMNILVYIFP